MSSSAPRTKDPGYVASNGPAHHLSADDFAAKLRAEISGKVVLITGPSVGGLGFEAARVIAKHGADLVLAGRSQTKYALSHVPSIPGHCTEGMIIPRLDDASTAIKTETPSAKLRTLIVDMASLASVASAAEAVNAYSEKIDVLINNASTLYETYTVTKDNIEATWETNHLGPFLFTKLIDKHLANNARVVNVTSSAHAIQPINFEDFTLGGGSNYQKWQSYGQSKTANMLFSLQIGKEWKDIESFSVNPGVVATNIWKVIPFEEQVAMGFRDASGVWTSDFIGGARSIGQGASGYITAAFDPSLKGHTGGYLVDAKMANEQAFSHATDSLSAEKLWKLSENMLAKHIARQ
ncbi:hypothetical protein P7C70_g1356, partial [Phenoliferia sp. Uapishka_3]